MLLIVAMLCSVVAQAQQEVNKVIDSQYINASHKAFIYQVSPENKVSDEWLIGLRREHETAKNVIDEIDPQDLAGDTSFTFSEFKGNQDTMFVPSEYIMSSATGTSENYVSHYDTYTWIPDSARWSPKTLRTTYREPAYGDSSITLYYNFNTLEPYYGTKNFYPKVKADGADYEYYLDNYNTDSGWQKRERGLSYKNESGQDTLTKKFEYDPETQEYVISAVTNYIPKEDYYLYANKYYYKGNINSESKTEQTLSFNLDEQKYYDYEGEISSWSLNYTKKEANNRFVYQITKQYDANLKQLVGKDSLHFIYSNNDKLVEAVGYEWLDSTWVMDEAYNSYQRTLANSKVVVDSVVVFKVKYNAETNTGELDGVFIKTEMDYDAQGNQIEVRNYSNSTDGLSLQSRVVREFMEISPGYFTQVKQWVYSKDHVTGELFKSSINRNIYDSENIYIGSSNFNLNAAGDTTYGYLSKREVLLDGSSGNMRFDWDNYTKKLVLKSYNVFGAKSTNDQGQNYTQSSYRYFLNGYETISRTINVYNEYLGVFNDGPIVAELGDTVSLYVSARNYDLTIPKIEVTNMPSSATFNPETRHFFWIVDEVNPSPMTYKAIVGEKFVTTQVEFKGTQLGVGSEVMEAPQGFELSQNYPNPFNPTTNIKFTLQQAGEVSLKVFNMLGQEVATLVNGRVSAGAQIVQFDASNLASGVYLYRLQAGNKVQTNKMLLIK